MLRLVVLSWLVQALQARTHQALARCRMAQAAQAEVRWALHQLCCVGLPRASWSGACAAAVLAAQPLTAWAQGAGAAG